MTGKVLTGAMTASPTSPAEHFLKVVRHGLTNGKALETALIDEALDLATEPLVRLAASRSDADLFPLVALAEEFDVISRALDMVPLHRNDQRHIRQAAQFAAESLSAESHGLPSRVATNQLSALASRCLPKDAGPELRILRLAWLAAFSQTLTQERGPRTTESQIVSNA